MQATWACSSFTPHTLTHSSSGAAPCTSTPAGLASLSNRPLRTVNSTGVPAEPGEKKGCRAI